MAPFFLGSEPLRISYPTDTVTQAQRLMAMRGNNPHLSRSIVFHEVIPGHHLKQVMNVRHRPYRWRFRTVSWTEWMSF